MNMGYIILDIVIQFPVPEVTWKLVHTTVPYSPVPPV